MNEYGQHSLWRDTATASRERARDLAARLERRAKAVDEVAARDAYLGLLAITAGDHVLDVGCGSGAVTRDIARRCAPAAVDGIDPSEAQLAFARARMPGDSAKFRVGDAMALPFVDDSFDAAVMALVIFFVPDPAKGVAEMARVTKPGGLVASYAWDILGGGFPANDVFAEMQAIGIAPPYPPSVAAAGLEESRSLWQRAGLKDIETTRITVERAFRDAEDYWETCRKGPGTGGKVKSLGEAERGKLRERVFARLGAGPVRIRATANAIRGRVAK